MRFPLFALKHLRQTVMAAFVIVAVCTQVPAVALAAPRKGYEAKQTSVTENGTFVMAPGESKQVTVEFKNIADYNWRNTGSSYVSLYTYDPKYHDSLFADKSWISKSQAVKIKEAKVGPGALGHFVFTLKAPTKTGTYKETFMMLAENITWIPGGNVVLNITVKTPSAKPATNATATPDTSAAPVVSPVSALILLRSEKKVTAEGGAPVTYTVGVKNTGTASWTKRELRLPDVSIASSEVDAAQTRHVSWLSPTLLAENDAGVVAPGGLDFFTFTFLAPKKSGTHVVRYMLAVNSAVVPDFSVDIPVEVTSDAPDVVDIPVTPEVQAIEEANVIPEPILRVGVLTVDAETDSQVVISCQSDWDLEDINGALLAEMKAGTRATAFYKKGKYWFNRGKGLEADTFALRFIPREANAVCQVENFDRRVTRNSKYANNQFRNILELRHNDYKNRTWLINEIPMEFYLKGIGETSNDSHPEFQKTLITIARTYALYHWERGTKYAKEFFHLTGYADDQVYWGYDQEARSPILAQSVEDTHGVVVTYDGKTAITPYFSRSDGRTRDWSEVWGGSVAWIKSVPCPCDVGKTLWGHGVGLSASEALCEAKNGKGWQDIIHYFYQNVQLMKRW